MKIKVTTNFTPDLILETRRTDARSGPLRPLLKKIAPTFEAVDSMIPLTFAPYGTAEPGRGALNFRFVLAAAALVLGLALYGVWRIVKRG